MSPQTLIEIRDDHSARAGRIALRVLMVVSLLGVLASGCDLSQVGRDWDRYPSQIEALAARHQPPDPFVQARQRGHEVYEHYCQICHGADAGGNGFNAALLDPPPRNLADVGFWKQSTDQQLFAAISKGGPAVGKSALMPVWGHTLSEQQIRDVVAYLRPGSDIAGPEGAEQENAGQTSAAEGINSPAD